MIFSIIIYSSYLYFFSSQGSCIKNMAQIFIQQLIRKLKLNSFRRQSQEKISNPKNIKIQIKNKHLSLSLTKFPSPFLISLPEPINPKQFSLKNAISPKKVNKVIKYSIIINNIHVMKTHKNSTQSPPSQSMTAATTTVPRAHGHQPDSFNVVAQNCMKNNQEYIWKRIKFHIFQKVQHHCNTNKIHNKDDIQDCLYQEMKAILQFLAQVKGKDKGKGKEDYYGRANNTQDKNRDKQFLTIKNQLAKMVKIAKDNQNRVHRRNLTIKNMSESIQNFFNNFSTSNNIVNINKSDRQQRISALSIKIIQMLPYLISNIEKQIKKQKVQNFQTINKIVAPLANQLKSSRSQTQKYKTMCLELTNSVVHKNQQIQQLQTQLKRQCKVSKACSDTISTQASQILALKSHICSLELQLIHIQECFLQAVRPKVTPDQVQREQLQAENIRLQENHLLLNQQHNAIRQQNLLLHASLAQKQRKQRQYLQQFEDQIRKIKEIVQTKDLVIWELEQKFISQMACIEKVEGKQEHQLQCSQNWQFQGNNKLLKSVNSAEWTGKGIYRLCEEIGRQLTCERTVNEDLTNLILQPPQKNDQDIQTQQPQLQQSLSLSCQSCYIQQQDTGIQCNWTVPTASASCNTLIQQLDSTQTQTQCSSQYLCKQKQAQICEKCCGWSARVQEMQQANEQLRQKCNELKRCNQQLLQTIQYANSLFSSTSQPALINTLPVSYTQSHCHSLNISKSLQYLLPKQKQYLQKQQINSHQIIINPNPNYNNNNNHNPNIKLDRTESTKSYHLQLSSSQKSDDGLMTQHAYGDKKYRQGSRQIQRQDQFAENGQEIVTTGKNYENVNMNVNIFAAAVARLLGQFVNNQNKQDSKMTAFHTLIEMLKPIPEANLSSHFDKYIKLRKLKSSLNQNDSQNGNENAALKHKQKQKWKQKEKGIGDKLYQYLTSNQNNSQNNNS